MLGLSFGPKMLPGDPKGCITTATQSIQLRAIHCTQSLPCFSHCMEAGLVMPFSFTGGLGVTRHEACILHQRRRTTLPWPCQDMHGWVT